MNLPLKHFDLMNARFAQSLHGQEQDLQSACLGGESAPDAGTAVAVRQGGPLGCPVPCQGFNSPFGDTAFLGCPFRGLGNAVFFT